MIIILRGIRPSTRPGAVQALPFGTEAWQLAHKHDRQLVESSNDFLKSGPESLDNPKNRRLRGLAAQHFIAVTAAVSANLRRIATFLGDRNRVKPKKKYPRGRDIRGLKRPRLKRPRFSAALIRGAALG